MPVNIRTVFAKPDIRLLGLFQKHSLTKKDNDENLRGLQQADCCSDRAIAFGALSYHDLRLFHFAVNNLRVFGISPLERHLDSNSGS